MSETKPTKVLIIDDDMFLLDMYALKFKQSGFDVDTALGSVPALEKLRAGTTADVILFDIVMPIMDGFELIEKIQAEHLAPNALRIILSNRGDHTDIERGKALNVAGYIVKANATPSEVIAHVTEIMNSSKAK
jgi:CheY-like chemotaxis protein